MQELQLHPQCESTLYIYGIIATDFIHSFIE